MGSKRERILEKPMMKWFLIVLTASSLVIGCGLQAAARPASSSSAASTAGPKTSSSSGATSTRGSSKDAPARGTVLKGKASYYSDSLAGRSTANGEPYDPKKLTAAHLELPFGTMVRVTRADNGKQVVVRINDRGPYGGRGRIIDLSRRAAQELDMIRAGVVDVEVEILGN